MVSLRPDSARYSSRFHNNYFTVLRSGSLEVTYLRLVDFCITHLQAESNKEEEEDSGMLRLQMCATRSQLREASRLLMKGA